MKTAVQLYTLREEASRNFEGVLKAVSNMGYDGVEFAGFYDIPAEDMSRMLQQYHLEAVAAHMPIDVLDNNLEGIAAYNKKIGNFNIVVPGMEMSTIEQVKENVEHLKPIIGYLKKHSMRVLYHNHSHELVLHEGSYLLDTFFSLALPDQLLCELDTYWIHRAGLDPAVYIRHYAGRCPLLHFKDLPNDRTESDFAALGDGIIDWPVLRSAALQAKVEWIIIENDNPKPNGLSSIERSIRYWRSIQK